MAHALDPRESVTRPTKWRTLWTRPTSTLSRGLRLVTPRRHHQVLTSRSWASCAPRHPPGARVRVRSRVDSPPAGGGGAARRTRPGAQRHAPCLKLQAFLQLLELRISRHARPTAAEPQLAPLHSAASCGRDSLAGRAAPAYSNATASLRTPSESGYPSLGIRVAIRVAIRVWVSESHRRGPHRGRRGCPPPPCRRCAPPAPASHRPPPMPLSPAPHPALVRRPPAGPVCPPDRHRASLTQCRA